MIDKTGQFVVKHDFDELSWTDSRYIGKRGTALYQLDGKGGEIQLPANASQESSWVKTELEAAREHDISLPFYYPRLNITRVDFCRLAVKLYQKVQPNASAAPAAAFSDCENESVCLTAALGIVTGYDDGTFRPRQSITRQKAALILYHTPTGKPLCDVLTPLRPIPHLPVKARKKVARKTGRLAFWRNYLSCTRSRSNRLRKAVRSVRSSRCTPPAPHSCRA